MSAFNVATITTIIVVIYLLWSIKKQPAAIQLRYLQTLALDATEQGPVWRLKAELMARDPDAI